MNMDEKRYIVECLALEFAKSEDDLRENYSGRGMYGSTCYGIVTDDPDELTEFKLKKPAPRGLFNVL